MAKKKRELTELERLQLILRYQQIQDGASQETIGELAAAFGVSRTYPAYLFRAKQNPGATLSSKIRSGRPTKITTKIMSKTVKVIRKQRKTSCRVLAKELDVSSTTALKIRRTLKFVGSKTKPRPLLSTVHMGNRLQWAKKYKNCQWKNWIFADFKWFNLHRGVKKSYYRPGSPRKSTETQSRHFLPKIMFYIAISKSAEEGKVGLYVCATREL
jgi:transposase